MEKITQDDIKSLQEFEKSDLDLRILSDSQLIFESDDHGIASVVNFIKKFGAGVGNLTIYDSVVGRAVALLFVYLSGETPQRNPKVKKVLGVIGSKKAEEVLKTYEIPFHFLRTVPCITNREQSGPCPFEQLSEGKTPEKFWKIVSERC